MDEIAEQFQALINNGDTSETACQRFLEQHTELLYTPHLLNHQLHFHAIITKLALDTTLITDFAYLTKSSVQWRLVLMELKRPSMRLFSNNVNRVTPSAELTAALAQVHSWRDYIMRNENAVRARVEQFLIPLGKNPLKFKYVLVAGRSSEFANNQSRIDRLGNLDSHCTVLTYDSLVSAYSNGDRNSKNIVRMTKGTIAFKHLHREPGSMFSFLLPHQLQLTRSQERQLRNWGFEIDEWRKGKALRYSDRFASKYSLLNKPQ